MIKITDVGGNEKYINCDLIERIEVIPDSLLVLVNGHNVIVKDKADDVIERIVAFRRSCNETANLLSVQDNDESAPEYFRSGLFLGWNTG